MLYKLDGGLDHLLLDEVQDTAPAQWRIAHALTEEFFAGEAARDAQRTVFAVGDRKQSIYSFQGADIEEFDRSHRLLRQRVAAAGKPWRDAQARRVVPLDRGRCWSWWIGCSPIRLAARRRGGCRASTLTHYADRAEHAGVVELWPLAPLPDAAEPQPWTVPEQNQRPDLGAAAAGGDAGALDRARDRRRRDAGEQGAAAGARAT